jgi:hypothetical protein
VIDTTECGAGTRSIQEIRTLLGCRWNAVHRPLRAVGSGCHQKNHLPVDSGHLPPEQPPSKWALTLQARRRHYKQTHSEHKYPPTVGGLHSTILLNKPAACNDLKWPRTLLHTLARGIHMTCVACLPREGCPCSTCLSISAFPLSSIFNPTMYICFQSYNKLFQISSTLCA